jgi:hypothetical protein
MMQHDGDVLIPLKVSNDSQSLFMPLSFNLFIRRRIPFLRPLVIGILTAQITAKFSISPFRDELALAVLTWSFQASHWLASAPLGARPAKPQAPRGSQISRNRGPMKFGIWFALSRWQTGNHTCTM